MMTLIDDACATFSDQRHKEALIGFKGYCRSRTTDQVVEELQRQAGVRAVA
jgi:ureidoacrylate peracid hydrolase